MLREIHYNRVEALEYAKQWALKRNPKYMNFEDLGGDCTNFSSQCILAGCGVMNYTPTFGWYYINSSNRSASWAGASFLYKFLINNEAIGPYAVEVNRDVVLVGDIIQLGDENDNFYHSVVVTEVTNDNIFVCSHSVDSYMRPIDSYLFEKIRYLNILGARE
ncbi:MAG: hypothetical protein RUMPE_01301 [Eubacteriales bacterium SKADARSKE-1]|nr:hypothetical protein [Eubacteriales bacterium SKADARSKE-1]